ncbi:MAG TPA: hypothetical protein PLT93_12200 [Phycisphaerae bacterium]|nr:hypothetical protein [Phycisphaerae bacterium]
MPAQFAPRGANFATEAAIASAGIMQRGAEVRARNFQEEQDRQQRMQLAQLEIQAQRERDARVFAQQALMQQRHAEYTALRDAQLDRYTTQRLERAREWQVYDKTLAETGASPATIRAEAIRLGRPYEEVYAELAEKRKRVEEERAYQRRLDYIRDSSQITNDIAQEKIKKGIRAREEYLREARNDPTMSATALAELERRVDFMNRQDAAGVKLPEPYDPVKDLLQNVQVDPRTGLSRYRTKDGEWRADPRTSQTQQVEEVDESEVDEYLNEQFAGQPKLSPTPNEFGFGVPEKDAQGNPIPKTAEDATPHERFVARLRLTARKQEAKVIQGMIMDMVKAKGVLPTVAAEAVLKQMQDRTSDFSIAQAQEEAAKRAKERDVAAARGETGQEASPLPPDPSQLKVGASYRLSNGQIGRWTGEGFEVTE